MYHLAKKNSKFITECEIVEHPIDGAINDLFLFTQNYLFDSESCCKECVAAFKLRKRHLFFPKPRIQ